MSRTLLASLFVVVCVRFFFMQQKQHNSKRQRRRETIHGGTDCSGNFDDVDNGLTMAGEKKAPPDPKGGGGKGGPAKKEATPKGDGNNKRSGRKRNKRNRRRGGGGGGGTGGGAGGGGGAGRFQQPQTKVTFRSICDADKYGSVKDVIDMIDRIIESVNKDEIIQTSKTRVPIRLDRASVDELVRTEELIKEAQEKAEKNLEEEKTDEKQQDGKDMNDGSAGEEGKTTDESEKANANDHTKNDEGNGAETNGDIGAAGESPKATMADIVKGKDPDSSVPSIVARILSVIPPKLSRRRGIRGGNAYVILTAPMPSVLECTAGDKKNGGSTTPPPVSKAERSAFTALGRLQLEHAIEAMSKHAQEDAKSQQLYAGCKIEASLSGKAWNRNARGDRREGTIEKTDDFKQFMEEEAKAQDELKNRPKPAPGGGLVAAAEAENEKTEKMAAIVLHLRAKHEEQNRRKQAKKKSSQAQKKDRKQQFQAKQKQQQQKEKQSNNDKEKGGRGKRNRRKDGNKKKQGGNNTKNKNKKKNTNNNGNNSRKGGTVGGPGPSGIPMLLKKPPTNAGTG